MGFQVEGDRQKGSRISLFGGRQMGFQVDGDRQRGSRILLFGGRQMGPHIGLKKKKRESPDGIPS